MIRRWDSQNFFVILFLFYISSTVCLHLQLYVTEAIVREIRDSNLQLKDENDRLRKSEFIVNTNMAQLCGDVKTLLQKVIFFFKSRPHFSSYTYISKTCTQENDDAVNGSFPAFLLLKKVQSWSENRLSAGFDIKKKSCLLRPRSLAQFSICHRPVIHSTITLEFTHLVLVYRVHTGASHASPKGRPLNLRNVEICQKSIPSSHCCCENVLMQKKSQSNAW